MPKQYPRSPLTVLAAAILAAASAALGPAQALALSAQPRALGAGPDAGQPSPSYSERRFADDRASASGARRASFETAAADEEHAVPRLPEPGFPDLQARARPAGLPAEVSKPRRYKLFLDPDQSTLNDLGLGILAAIADDWGGERPALELAGYADCAQPDPCQGWLSKRGVERVRDLLVTRGFEPARISVPSPGTDGLSVTRLNGKHGPRHQRLTVVITVK